MKTLQAFLLALALSALSLTAAAQCDASFNYDTVNGGIYFTPVGGYYQSYHWNFGQGPADTSNEQNPTFGFAATGTYNVCLTVTNYLTDSTAACTNTQCVQVQATPCALAANLVTASYTYVNNKFTLNFTNTSTGANLPLSYNWSFNGGSPASSTVANAVVTYPNVHAIDARVVSLTVTDALGCTGQFSQAINVLGNSPCQAQIGYYSLSPGNYNFADSLELTGYNYLWTFGDGGTSTQATPNHQYTTNGNYNVCLAISSTSPACADTICTNIHAQVCGTVASFTDTLSGLTGDVVNFTSTSTAQNPPLTYWWYSRNTSAGEPGSTFSITETGSGTDDITLIVIDAAGCMDSINQTITFGPTGPITINALTTGGGCPAMVYLILQDSIGHLVLVDSLQQGDSSGNCYGATFTTTIPGTYYVKGALTTANSNYANYLPTYSNSALSWANAAGQYINSTYYTYNFNVAMQQGTNTGGPGFIGGYVSEGAGLEVRPTQGGAVNEAKALGDALAGIQIDLTTEAGAAVAYTHTDANGHYQFANLAYGTYVLFTDVLNSKPSPITVTLSAQNPTDSLANDSVQQSALTGITNLTNFTLDRVYPDPVINNVTLTLTSAAETSATLKLVDMLGRTQLQKPVTLTTGQNTFTLAMDQLANGVYQLLLQTTTKTIAYKLVKVK